MVVLLPAVMGTTHFDIAVGDSDTAMRWPCYIHQWTIMDKATFLDVEADHLWCLQHRSRIWDLHLRVETLLKEMLRY